MITLVDIGTVIAALLFTLLIYILYYLIFVIGYINRIKRAVRNGEVEKANKMKNNALKKQPKKMTRLFQKYGL
jgi:hypothetical protein